MSVVQRLPSSQLGGATGVQAPCMHADAPQARSGSQSLASLHGTQGCVPPAVHIGQGEVATVQSLRQPSHSFWLPSSHCSPGSTRPLPQTSILQVLEQPSPERVLKSSHSSPQFASICPLPQPSVWQKCEHPSQSTALPSSQVSPSSTSTTPSPHRGGTRI